MTILDAGDGTPGNNTPSLWSIIHEVLEANGYRNCDKLVDELCVVIQDSYLETD